jgi:hypothetical protein
MSTPAVTRLETRTERLWREFVEARDRAWASQAIGDGIAAGRAFWAFYMEFCPESVPPPPDLPTGRP